MNRLPPVAVWRGLAALAWLFAGLPGLAQEPVTLQLKWTHAFQFAGYYAAKEQGYYHEAGLEVTIVEGYPGVDVVGEVLSGRAQFGTGSSGLLLARHAGKPVVVLAVIYQHSPLVIIARQDDPAQSIHDLIGKRIMLEPQSEELLAYLAQQGISPDDITILEHSFDYQDLIDGHVDAISAYSTYEVFHLTQAGFPFHMYSPRAAGIDFYGDNLFSSEEMIRANPERVEAFRAASLRGWEYAMANPEAMVELILERYPAQHGRDFYTFEAGRMVPLLRPDLIELGYMHQGRWRHIANTYAGQGMLPHDVPLDDFLYTVQPEMDWTEAYPYLAVGIALMALVCAFAVYVHHINRRLAVNLAELHETKDALAKSEERYRHMAQHDMLTGLPNRALFADLLERGLSLARREKKKLALMFLDLDNFKSINDTHGHALGDRVLQEIAGRVTQAIRDSDTVGRIGGDEFVVLLPMTEGAADARRVAEKVRAAIHAPCEVDGQSIELSASIGIALYPDDGADAVELFRHADEAMYAAKEHGRDRITVFHEGLGQ